MQERGGQGLLDQYNNSVLQAVAAAYPQYIWHPWLLQLSHNSSFWSDTQSHIRYFEWLAEELEVRRQEDWYKLSYTFMLESGGGSLLSCYGNSFVHTIASLLPQYSWHEWLFEWSPR